MLTSTREHYRRQQRLTAAGVLDARRSLRRGTAFAAETVAAYQILVARDAAAAVAPMLEEQGIDSDPVAAVRAESVAGTASDGRSLVGLIDQAETDYQFGLIVATQLQDIARAAFSLGQAVRPQVDGYVRVLNPPSCSRCAVLCGKFFRWNTGFDRHPRCDCRHEPTTREAWRDLVGSNDPTSNPNAFFSSLSTSEQDRIFTQAGAQALRDGADLSQVVNARRDMYRAQQFGLNNNGIYVATNRTQDGLLFTTEGTTTRGAAFRSLNERFVDPAGSIKTRISGGTRYSRATTVRLMPESIYEIAAGNRDEALRLLRLHGYIR